MPVLELTAERMAAGGDAIARHPDGRVVFVTGALPGERVRARLVDERRDYLRAVTATVVDPSPARVAPPCPHLAAGCGGCPWQHVDPAHQVALKREVVVDALRRTGGLPDARVDTGPALPAWGFRTTLRLGVDRAGRVGFRRFHGHDVVPVDACPVAHPLLDELLGGLRCPGGREVLLRAGAATGERAAAATPARARLEGLPVDVATGRAAVVHEVVAGHRFRVSMRSFFQTRADGAEALVAEVRAALGPLPAGARVVDAYAGVGLFAATLPDAGRVVAVEADRWACRDARHNLRDRPAEVVEGPVEAWTPEPADAVVADPARRGLGRDAVDVLAATGAAVLALVSCDPVSLARDARLLAAHEFRHERSVVVDLFPHTPHVEVVTRFAR